MKEIFPKYEIIMTKYEKYEKIMKLVFYACLWLCMMDAVV